jgi:DNA polymerase-1
MAHLASDKALIAAFESGEDLHISVAAQIFDLPPDEITTELRNQIKAVSYGLAYGLSAYGLSQSLRIDVTEADKLMSKFFERFAGVRDYLRSAVEVARDKGYTETILGRRRYLPELNHDNKFRREVAERAALNAPIQGSAADIIKLAMIQLNDKLHQSDLEARMLLQVHDELVLESSLADCEAVKELAKTVMQNVMDLSVSLDVSVGSGKSWLTAAH